MANFTTFTQMQKQTERLKNFFENELNSGKIETISGGAKFIYKYRNDESPTILQGVNSAENVLIEGKNITVPASSSTVTVYGGGFNFDFASGNVSVASGVSNSSIMASGAVTIFGNGGGNLYQYDNSTILNYTDKDTVFSNDGDAIKAASALGTAYYFLRNIKGNIKGAKKEDAETDTLNDYNELGNGDTIIFQNSNGELTTLGVSLNLYAQMKTLEKNKTFQYWEEIKLQKGDNATAANNRSVFTGGAYYGSGNINRVEALLLNGNAFASSKGNPYKTGIDQTGFDDLFINIQGEENKNLTTNGDLDLDFNAVSGDWDYGDTLSGNAQYNYRIHFPIIIVKKYPIRDGKSATDDSLYVYIEQEPIKQEVTLSDGSTFTREDMSSVRQIIINNDVANTDSTTTRPPVFFYEGPEIPLKQYHPDLYDSDGDYIGERPFLPVILNLWRNFRGIVFAPNNPVIINGNGYKIEGFVVAREFRRLKLATDFENAKYTSGTDEGMPVYISAFYNGSSSFKYFVEVSNWQEKTSSATSGYTSIKVLFNGNEMTGWVKNGQYYASDVNPDVSKYAQINLNGDTDQYSLYDDLLLETSLNGKTYLVNYNGRFYTPILTESVTYTGTVDSLTLGNFFSSNGKTITQKVYPGNTPMYVSGTKYTYTETYVNTEGVTKTKTTIMNVGDVQYENVTASDAAVDGNYTEKPENVDTFADDDKLRYDYVNVFNLNSNSTYNSFGNISLENYTYLEQSEEGSHDMFFTTARLKHID